MAHSCACNPGSKRRSAWGPAGASQPSRAPAPDDALLCGTCNTRARNRSFTCSLPQLACIALMPFALNPPSTLSPRHPPSPIVLSERSPVCSAAPRAMPCKHGPLLCRHSALDMQQLDIDVLPRQKCQSSCQNQPLLNGGPSSSLAHLLRLQPFLCSPAAAYLRSPGVSAGVLPADGTERRRRRGVVRQSVAVAVAVHVVSGRR